MPLTFSTEEMELLLEGNATEELKNKYHEAKKYNASSGLRASVKTMASDNAARFTTDNLSKLDIPAGVKEIALLYDYNTEADKFVVRKSGVKVDMAAATLAVPGAPLQSLVSKAVALKDDDKKAIILDFITKGLGGKTVVDHVMSVHTFNKTTKPALDAVYTNTNAAALSAGISEIPEGDKLRVIIKWTSLEDAGWLAPAVTCGKTVGGSGGSGDGTRKKRTPAPEGYSSWKDFVERDQSAETKTALKWATDKYGQEWTKSISASNLLRGQKHPAMLAADSENPARM